MQQDRPLMTLTIASDDREEIETYTKARDYASVIWDLSQQLRAICKHGHFGGKQLNEAELDMFWKFRDWFYTLVDEYDLPDSAV